MAEELQHDFPNAFAACRACGLYVEECLEWPVCAGRKIERQRSVPCEECGLQVDPRADACHNCG